MQLQPDAVVGTMFPAAPVSGAAPPLIEGLANLPGKIASGAQSERPGPDTVLTDFTLPPPAREILDLPLRLLSFRIDIARPKDWRRVERQYTVATRNDVRIAFLHIERGILGDAVRADGVASLGYLLEARKPVRILSVDAVTVAVAYENVWLQWKWAHGIDAKYVAWSYLAQLGAIRDERERADLLLPALGLDPEDLAPPVERAHRLRELANNPDDMERLVTLLTGAAVDSGKEAFFRDLVVTQPTFRQAWKAEKAWTGAPEVLARELLQWLIRKGTNPQQRDRTALASVLERLLEHVQLEDIQFLLHMFEKYDLITTAGVIEDLRRQYLH